MSEGSVFWAGAACGACGMLVLIAVLMALLGWL